MISAIDLFVCGLCQFIVTPYPLECSACNKLFCESCVQMQRSWKCPHQNCQSRMATKKVHRSVQEIMELLNFNCPGCGQRKRYEAIFNHVKTCERIQPDVMVSNEQVQKIVAQNQNAVPVVSHQFSTLARNIYILEKDSKNLLQYDRQTNRVARLKLNYRVNGMEVALPHNYQCVQVGDGPKLYLIGGGDYQQAPASMYETNLLQYN